MSAELAIGDTVAGRYALAGVLGRGGMATTYEAVDRHTGGRVAVKVLSLATMKDWKAVELFEREARVLRNVDHPAIPRYVDSISPDPAAADASPSFVLVQELAPGRQLSALIEDGWRVTEAELRELATQVLDILIYLHGLSPPVIHRDIKPQNLIRDDAGTVRLVDFGAVRDSVSKHTSVGGSTVVGTYGYMAPEQFQGRASPASDLYGLGASLIHLVTHKPPSELPHARLKIDFRGHTNLPEPIAAWLDRMIEPAVEDRFPSAAAARDALATAGAAPARALVPAASAAVGPGSSTALVRRPAGTKVALDRGDGRLRLRVPPTGLRGANLFLAGFSIAWLGFVTFWTVMTVVMGAPIFFTLFSIPFWIAGGGMIRRVLSTAAGSTQLELDGERFRITQRILGIPYRTSRGATVDITDVSIDAASMFSQRPSLMLREGVRKHFLERGLEDVEQKWIASELRDFLRLPQPE